MRLLESNYIRATSLGATPTKCGGSDPKRYQWKEGKCVNMLTGAAYPGDQKLSNCQCLHGNAPAYKGKAGVVNFLKDAFFGGSIQGGQPLPQSSVTAPNLLLPAVAVVGGVALLLILKKKK